MINAVRLKKTIVLVAALLFSGMSFAQTSDASANFPTKTVRLVVPFAAGGVSDVLARTLGQKLSEAWKQPVVVENKAGADGNLGADYVSKALADGYTLLLVDTSTITISPVLMSRMTYDPLNDLQPISLLTFSPYGLVVNPAVPASTFKELVAYGKANPGKLNFSAGTMGHKLSAAQLRFASGVEWATVPYRGGAAALNAVIAGEADVTVVGLMSALPQIQGSRVRAMAVTGLSRSSAAPDIPTLAEAGIPDMQIGSWQGIFAPKGTPAAIIQKINASFVAALNEPSVKATLTAQGTEIIGGSPEKFRAFLSADTKQWKSLAAKAGMKPE
jgi:tripartite-type tricarboxylate transporter receptor subunit TctC